MIYRVIVSAGWSQPEQAGNFQTLPEAKKAANRIKAATPQAEVWVQAIENVVGCHGFPAVVIEEALARLPDNLSAPDFE